MLEQDSVHLVNARELLRDTNEIAPTQRLESRLSELGPVGATTAFALLLSGLSGQIVLISPQQSVCPNAR